MGRTAFIFPGQGAQYLGMGKDFYNEYKESRECFERSADVLGIDIAKICFEDEEKLNMTEYTQAAMLTVIGAMLAVVEKSSFKADETAGLSLGEYASLLKAGAASYEDVIKLVRKRGILMQEAYPEGGAMAAVLGLSNELAKDVIMKARGIVTVANYNCPGQLVISGEVKAVKEAGEAMLIEGAKKVVMLNVSGPFHSVLLKEAGDALADELKSIEFNKPSIPYVANVTAEYVTECNSIKELLAKQVSSSVRWQQSVEVMIKNGVETFVEIGPGKTLAGFIKRIDKGVKIININTTKDISMYI